MPSPRQTFEDNIRPAELLLRVYRLLDTNDQLVSDGQLVESLRGVVKASKDVFSWTRQAVDTVQHICLALDELVATKMEEYRSVLAQA